MSDEQIQIVVATLAWGFTIGMIILGGWWLQGLVHDMKESPDTGKFLFNILKFGLAVLLIGVAVLIVLAIIIWAYKTVLSAF